MAHVNHLYLQSLLDPHRFKFACDKWLFEIQNKLNEYKSTEVILSTVANDDIKKEIAGEGKYSPLPIRVEERRIVSRTRENGKREKRERGGREKREE